MSEWHATTLGEIVALGEGKIQTGPFGSQLHASDYRETGVPCIMPVNIVDNLINSTGIMRISEKDAERLSRYILVEGDIVYSRRGDVTRKALVGKDESGWFCGTGCLMIRPGNMVHPKFLNYHLAEPDTKEWIIRHAVGATMPNLNTEIMAAVPLAVPSFDSQIAIANILSSFDEKIVLNRKLNETLEQMARALFQSWFVDFDPVKAKLAAKRHGRDPERACMAAISGKLRIPAGKPREERLDDQLPTADELDAAIAALDALTEAQRRQLAETVAHFPSDFQESELGLIPTGWDTKPFSEIFEINPRRALRKNTIAPYLDMKSVPTSGPSPEEAIQREFKSGTKFINGDTLLARITPCLENGKTAFVDFLKDGEVGWGSTEFIVIRPKNISSSIGYFYARSYELRTHAINNMSGTSGRQRVPAECFNNFLIISPENYFLYEEFTRIAQAVLNSIRSNSDQSRTLAELRDTLLPKLLSGELSVSAAEDAVEKAAEPC